MGRVWKQEESGRGGEAAMFTERAERGQWGWEWGEGQGSGVRTRDEKRWGQQELLPLWP